MEEMTVEARDVAGMQVATVDGAPTVIIVHRDADDTTKAVIEVVTCQWFAKCDSDAVTLVAHPILGEVPACAKHAEVKGVTAQSWVTVAS